MKLNEYVAAITLGGSEEFTCEYHGDSGVRDVTWSHNIGDIPADHSITQVLLQS